MLDATERSCLTAPDGRADAAPVPRVPRTVARVAAREQSRQGVRLLVVAALLAVLAVLAVAGAPSAQAHNTLRSSDPADGATVPFAPDHVTLTFDEDAVAIGTQVVVTSPDGTVVSEGDAVLDAGTVTQAVTGDRPAGTYTVTWRVTSADGHPVSGELTFVAADALPAPIATADPTVEPTTEPASEPTAESVATDPTPAPDATIQPDDDGGLPVAAAIGLVVLGLAILGGILLAVVIVLRRRD